MSALASQITGIAIVCSTVCSGLDERNHQSSASLAFVRGMHLWPMDYPHKGPGHGKCFHLMTSSCPPTGVWVFSHSACCLTVTVGATITVPSHSYQVTVINRSISQIPQCTCPIPHNAPFSNRNVNISVTKWRIVGYLSDALWDLWERSIKAV